MPTIHWFNGAFVSANRIPKRDQNPLWCIGGTMRYHPASTAVAAAWRSFTADIPVGQPGQFPWPCVADDELVTLSVQSVREIPVSADDVDAFRLAAVGAIP